MSILKLNDMLCTRCLKCVNECPSHSLGRSPDQSEDGFPRLINGNCIKCQHCLAICPEGAISIWGVDPSKSMTMDPEKLPGPIQIEQLMKGRRSIRFYKEDNIPRSDIDKLLDIAYHAPTGVNRQGISFKVIYERKVMDGFKKQFYTAVENAVDRAGTVGQSDFLSGLVQKYREQNRDIFFRDAPHILFAVGNEDSSIVRTDGVIAGAYFELATASFGYGTVWNGYVTHAVNAIPEIRDLINLKKNEVMCFALCFGIPDVSFKRTVQRGRAAVEELKDF